MDAGFTRLRKAPRLAAELGLNRLWVKADGGNPTHSFKDRVVSVALSAARGFGYETVACASTGNLANSVAAHSSAAGMPSVVFIPAGLEMEKVAATTVYGGEVVEIDGSYDDVSSAISKTIVFWFCRWRPDLWSRKRQKASVSFLASVWSTEKQSPRSMAPRRQGVTP